MLQEIQLLTCFTNWWKSTIAFSTPKGGGVFSSSTSPIFVALVAWEGCWNGSHFELSLTDKQESCCVNSILIYSYYILYIHTCILLNSFFRFWKTNMKEWLFSKHKKRNKQFGLNHFVCSSQPSEYIFTTLYYVVLMPSSSRNIQCGSYADLHQGAGAFLTC